MQPVQTFTHPGEAMQRSPMFTGAPVAQLSIASDFDVVAARRRGRSVATAASFAPADVALVAAAISELARNIVPHAKRGEITIQLVEFGDQCGIRIEACDEGPGIADVEAPWSS
jgi:serine/threonine-protein kinase RsbT